MSSESPKGFVLPDVRKARMFGLAGVILATIAILTANLGGAAYYAFLPSMTKMMREQEKQVARVEKEDREARLQELRDQESSAKTPAEKKTAHDELTDFEATPPSPTPPMSMMFEGYSDRRVLTWHWVDIGLNLAINIVLIVGCGGLIALREWGRKMTIVASIVKLVECVLITLILAVVVAPIIGDAMGSRFNVFMKEMMVFSGPGVRGPAPMQDMRQILTIVNAGGFVLWGGLGLIWPIMLLVSASSKGVKAACVASDRPRNGKPTPQGEWESELS